MKCTYLTHEDGVREELAVLPLVEPRALEIEERDAGQVREGERIEGELSERLPGGRVTKRLSCARVEEPRRGWYDARSTPIPILQALKSPTARWTPFNTASRGLRGILRGR